MFVKKFSFIILFAVSILSAQSEEEMFKLSEDQNSSVTQAQQYKEAAKDILRNDISTGKALAAMGAAINMIGAGLWTTSACIELINNEIDATPVAQPMRVIGSVLMGIGPIPACAGSKKVNESLEDLTGETERIPYWTQYRRGWAFVLIGEGVALIGSLVTLTTRSLVIYLVSNLTGLVILTFGEVQWAKASFGSLNYIRRIERKEKVGKIQFSFAPHIDINGNIGATLLCDF